MQSINETICDIFGNEVGLLAYEKIIGTEEAANKLSPWKVP